MKFWGRLILLLLSSALVLWQQTYRAVMMAWPYWPMPLCGHVLIQIHPRSAGLYKRTIYCKINTRTQWWFDPEGLLIHIKFMATGVNQDYLHGFTEVEQNRLYEQARLVESFIFEGVNFNQVSNLLEIGSGVGAQTEILLRRFPHLKIDCVDASPEQVKAAKQRLTAPISDQQVSVHEGDAMNLPFADDTYDGAFICWLLEHVNEPVEILKEVRRKLRPRGKVVCNEVMNATFFVDPYCHYTTKYWFELNDHQWNIGGDPFVGSKLGYYLKQAGFSNVEVKVKNMLFDERDPVRRKDYLNFWRELMLSAADGLKKAGKVDDTLIQKMDEEMRSLQDNPASVLFYSWMQAEAYK